MPIVCPRDGKDDSIQNLQSLVLGGTASGTFSGPSSHVTYNNGNYGYSSGTTTLSGTLTSDLAWTLARPAPPKEISGWALYGWAWLFYLSICIIIGPFLVWPRFKRSIVSDPSYQKIVFTPGVTFLCIIGLFVGWIPWFFGIPQIMMKNMLKKRLDYPRRYQQWYNSCAVWERLFYCHRCCVVFDPVTNESFHPNQMHSYLNTSAYGL